MEPGTAGKIFLSFIILETPSFNQEIKKANLNPFEQKQIVICSYHFARTKEPVIFSTIWNAGARVNYRRYGICRMADMVQSGSQVYSAKTWHKNQSLKNPGDSALASYNGAEHPKHQDALNAVESTGNSKGSNSKGSDLTY
jgi:hypothetical protein